MGIFIWSYGYANAFFSRNHTLLHPNLPSSLLPSGHLASCSLLGETTGHGAQFRREWFGMNELIVHPFVDQNARISGG